MRNLATWKLICQSLDDKVAVILLFVLHSSGSSPGRQGFCMAVTGRGDFEGSIGGGIMEHKFVEMAKDRLAAGNDEPTTIIRKQVHDKSASADQSGMICSGEQTILLYRVGTNDHSAIVEMIHSICSHKNGTFFLSPAGIQFDPLKPILDVEYGFETDEKWYYRERTGYKNQLFIIGGGHCSIALSRLMRSLDFYICVYDDRPGLKTLIGNEAAHETHLIDHYGLLPGYIQPGDHSYVVIMTFGYRTDDLALRSLLGLDFRYIGLLGSQAKVDKLFHAYHQSGILREQLHKIMTPAGLAIRSQTPEEIAVSIAAEIIRAKNQ